MFGKILIAVMFFGLIPHIACAQHASSADLINNAKQYDGKIIDYRGEIIGDIMVRDRYAWININDGQNAIGIWTNKILINDITHKGSYNFKGDVVEVTGKFNRSCPEHAGDLDIHAQSIRKIASGIQIFESLDFSKIKIALMLLGIILLLYILRLTCGVRGGSI